MIQLVTLVALGVIAAFFYISDWKRREVDLRGVLLAYCAVIAVNAGLILSGRAVIDQAAALSIIFLSGVLLVFWRTGLLAFGDVVSIPSMLLMLLTLPSSLVGGLHNTIIMLYFVTALAFVAVTSFAKNLRNNLRYRNELYGSLQQKIHLMLFCYYGDGSILKHAFKYNDDFNNNNNKQKKKLRRDYDREEYYCGKEKTWLMPGLPLLSGFLPATIMLAVLVWLLQ